MSIPAYTDADRIGRKVSILGIDLRVDHDPEALDQCITDASAEITFYCWRYNAAALAQSDWIQKAATDIAIYFLYCLRGNEPPISVKEMYEKTLENLTKVQDGKTVLSGVPLGQSGAPTVTNYRVDLDRYPSMRVERPRTTGKAPQGYKRRIDPTADRIDMG